MRLNADFHYNVKRVICMSEQISNPSKPFNAFIRRVTQPIWLLSIGALFVAFGVYWVLNHTLQPVYFIYCKLDDYIPFNEWFALPYVYWFGFLPIAMVQMLRHRDSGHASSRSDYLKYMLFFFISWALCLIVYLFFPTAIDFRPTPDEIGSKNFCAAGLSAAYNGFDLPINVLPSLHCTSTLAACIGVLSSSFVQESRYKGLYYGYYIVLTALICSSTVLVKQHSVLDIFAAFGVIAVVYPLVYLVKWKKDEK